MYFTLNPPLRFSVFSCNGQIEFLRWRYGQGDFKKLSKVQIACTYLERGKTGQYRANENDSSGWKTKILEKYGIKGKIIPNWNYGKPNE